MGFAAISGYGQTITSITNNPGYSSASNGGSADSTGTSISSLTGTVYSIGAFSVGEKNNITAADVFSSSTGAAYTAADPSADSGLYLTEVGTFNPTFNTGYAGEIDYGSKSGTPSNITSFLNPTSSTVPTGLHAATSPTSFTNTSGITFTPTSTGTEVYNSNGTVNTTATDTTTSAPMALQITGSLNITTAGTVVAFTIDHDEAYQLQVGTDTVSNATYGNDATVDLTFTQIGSYSLTLDLVNTDGEGVLGFQFAAQSGSLSIQTNTTNPTTGGVTGVMTNTIAPVDAPEGSTASLILLALAGLGVARYASRGGFKTIPLFAAR